MTAPAAAAKAPRRRAAAWLTALTVTMLLPLAGLGAAPGGVERTTIERHNAPPSGLRRPDPQDGGDVSATLSPFGAASLTGLLPDPATACLPVDAPWRKLRRQADLHRLMGLVAQSALGRWLLRQAAWRGVLICLDPATSLNGYYRSGRRIIAIRSGLGTAERVMFLAHELAHVLQHPRFSNNRYFSPHHMILLHRMREAAAEAVATWVIWQLRDNGYGAPWHRKAATRYGDIVAVFETAMAGARGPVAERAAARAAFGQWFEARWRIDFYDRLILRQLERIARDPMGLVPARRWLSDGFLRQLGWLDGDNYLEPADGPPLIDGPFDVPLSAANTKALGEILTDAYRAWREAP